jgi:hypothetical protein
MRRLLKALLRGNDHPLENGGPDRNPGSRLMSPEVRQLDGPIHWCAFQRDTAGARANRDDNRAVLVKQGRLADLACDQLQPGGICNGDDVLCRVLRAYVGRHPELLGQGLN